MLVRGPALFYDCKLDPELGGCVMDITKDISFKNSRIEYSNGTILSDTAGKPVKSLYYI
jgi:hypothetical protein